MKSAPIVEIMSTIQGEGLYVGVRELFIRFAECNLNCTFCDTRFNPTEHCSIETNPGKRDYYCEPNPITVDRLVQLISGFGLDKLHGVSLTGGEPLLWTDYLQELIPHLSSQGLKILLETNGTLYDQLLSVIDIIDIVSMDIKLPSVAGNQPLWDEHKRFLAIARKRECFVKIVVSEQMVMEELVTACRVIREVGAHIPLILQPVTAGTKNMQMEPEPCSLIGFQDEALKWLENVRVIPQTHKYLGQL